MKNQFLLLLFCGLFTLVGCQQDEDCVGCNLNPKIKLRFEADKTRKKTEQALDTLSKQLKNLRTTLQTEITEEQRNEINVQIAALKVDSAAYGEIYNLIKVGKTKLNTLSAKGATNLEQFADSIIRDFAIPVDMARDTSTFYFNYQDFTDTLQVFYQRDIVQTLDGMRMKIYGIGIVPGMTTFDSTHVKCLNPDCSNDLTTVYVYY